MNIQITLPDQLARDAERAGLLTPELLEKWLRERLREQRIDQLFSAIDRMDGVDDTALLSPESVAEEIAAMRSERRASNRS